MGLVGRAGLSWAGPTSEWARPGFCGPGPARPTASADLVKSIN